MPCAQRDRWRMRWPELLGSGSEAESARLVLHQPARGHHRPGQHDVLADRVRPAADCPEIVGPVCGERTLGDKRAVVCALHALDTVDPEPVVPGLHPAEEVVGGILDHQRACACADMLVLGTAPEPGDQVAERLRMQEGVGVDGHHDRSLHALERGVQCPVLPRLGLEDAAEVQPARRAASSASSAVRSVELLSARTTSTWPG